MASFKCDIVTPAEKLAACEVEMVVVPGVEGEMGFLAGHAPLVYVQVTDDKVIILADSATPVAA